jgi:hypothetical protein
MQATPAAITLWVGSLVMSWPSNVIRPARGGVSPRIERISVVLPEPFEPSRQVMRPGSIVNVTPLSTSALS